MADEDPYAPMLQRYSSGGAPPPGATAAQPVDVPPAAVASPPAPAEDDPYAPMLKRYAGASGAPAAQPGLADTADVPGRQQTTEPERQAAVGASGAAWGAAADIGHKVGVGTRNVAEGIGVESIPAQLVNALTWPARAGLRALGVPVTAPTDLVQQGIDATGLPQAQTPGEQASGAVISGAASALPTAGAGMIPSVARALPAVASTLTTGIPSQIVAGGAAGGASEGARQAGYGPLVQTGAGLLAGLVGGGLTAPRPALQTAPGAGPRFIQEYFGEGTPENPLARLQPPPPPNPTNAPSFVPPGAAVPPFNRILELIRQDDQTTANKPAMIPPTTSTDPITGQVTPIQQPPVTGPAAPRTVPGAVPPTEVPPGGAPQPVGAQTTPPASAAMTPQEEAMNRSNAEQQKLLETQQPGVQDPNVYVPGNNPTEAQIEQTVNAAREMKNLRNVSVDVSQESREAADRANSNRQGYYADTAGSQFDMNAAQTARDQTLTDGINRVFRNKGDADAQGVVDTGNSILNGPDGKVDPVIRNVTNVMGKLYDKDGNLDTDPEMLWGVRKQINLLMSKEAAIADPTNQAAVRQLMQMRNAVDAAIEPAAPGFHDVLQRYAADSRPIDAMELLQGREAKLHDNLNRMQYSPVQRMMREAVAARHPDAPLNPWQSLTDDQMGRLWNLRDDLRRSASAEDLARASGSDTAPNLIDMAKSLSGAGVSTIPVLGPMLWRAKTLAEPALRARAARQDRVRGMQMLYPSETKYPLRNQLTPGN